MIGEQYGSSVIALLGLLVAQAVFRADTFHANTATSNWTSVSGAFSLLVRSLVPARA